MRWFFRRKYDLTVAWERCWFACSNSTSLVSSKTPISKPSVMALPRSIQHMRSLRQQGSSQLSMRLSPTPLYMSALGPFS